MTGSGGTSADKRHFRPLGRQADHGRSSLTLIRKGSDGALIHMQPVAHAGDVLTHGSQRFPVIVDTSCILNRPPWIGRSGGPEGSRRPPRPSEGTRRRPALAPRREYANLDPSEGAPRPGFGFRPVPSEPAPWP